MAGRRHRIGLRAGRSLFAVGRASAPLVVARRPVGWRLRGAAGTHK
jgi:hypothetical protein